MSSEAVNQQNHHNEENMGQEREHLSQAILQTKTEDDSAGCCFDGHHLFRISNTLHKTITNRDRSSATW